MEKIAKIFQTIVFFPIYAILKVVFNFKIIGHENLKGMKNKAIIFAANHVHPLDGIITAVAIAMPWNGFKAGEFLPVRYLAFEDYFKWIRFRRAFAFPFSPLAAGWFRLSACIPVRSRKKDEIGKISLINVLTNAIDALKNGQKLFIFPEGKMSKNGKLQRGKKGVACLQKVSGAPVVPMAIIGSYNMGKNFWRYVLRKESLVVKIGTPILLFNPSPNRPFEEAADMVMDNIKELM